MVDSLAEAGTMERPMLERVAERMTSGNRQGLMGMFGGRGGRGAGQPPLADTGEYTVVIKVGGREFTQTFTVAKGPGADAGGGFFEELR